MRGVSIVVLAAGRSRRFRESAEDGQRSSPKQLARFEDEPLVRRAARTALAAGPEEVIVVVGQDGERVAAALDGLEVRCVANPDFARGQSSSMRVGLEAVRGRTDAVLFMPCDQPLVETELLRDLAARYRRGRVDAVASALEGAPRTPAIFGRELFERLSDLEGDVGARGLFDDPDVRLATVEVAGPLVLFDVDTVDDLNELARRRRTHG